jgi:preprotein translocase subunit SecD
MIRVLLLTLVLILAGCGSGKQEVPDVRIEFRLVEAEPAEGLVELNLSATEKTFYAHAEVLISNADIDSACITTGNGRYAVEIIMTGTGLEKWVSVTEEHVGKQIGMIVDGQLISAPVVRAPIRVGKAVISGDLSEDECTRIVAGINGTW